MPYTATHITSASHHRCLAALSVTLVMIEQHVSYVAGSGKRAGAEGLFAAQADQAATQAATDRYDPAHAHIASPMQLLCTTYNHICADA